LLPAVNLVEVQFEPAGKIVFVRPGTTLLAASEAAGVEIACGCCRGMCGTDPVRAEPQDALAPPTDPERSTLERMGLDPAFRLSCSARVERGVVKVELGRF
jgi:ferredoxin